MTRKLAYEPQERRHQFLFLFRCGCPFGLVEGSYAKDEDGAWDLFAEDRKDERRLRASGVHVVHVSHEEYVRDWFERMKKGCVH